MSDLDVLVVGGGAAGLAAASWLGRFRRSVLVVDSGDYRARSVERSHGYLGRDPQTPLDLLARGREEVLAYPTASVQAGRVDCVARRPDGLFTTTLDGEQVLARRVVLACGVKDAFPQVDGFAEHYGASVFHCPACDGYEARDRDVVALGWDAQLAGFAATLLNWASSVTVVTDGHRFEGDRACRALLGERQVELVEQEALALEGVRGHLRSVRLRGGRVLPASLVFFSVAHRPRIELAVGLGCRLDEQGYVVVDGEGCTSTPGVYAAGDLVPGLQLVQVAAASGTVAGVGCAQSFFGEDSSSTSPAPGPDPAVTAPGR